MTTQLSPEARSARRELATRVLLAIVSSGTYPSPKAFKGAEKMSGLQRTALVSFKLVDALLWWEEKSLEEPKPQENSSREAGEAEGGL